MAGGGGGSSKGHGRLAEGVRVKTRRLATRPGLGGPVEPAPVAALWRSLPHSLLIH
jgi:hypothetical protein